MRHLAGIPRSTAARTAGASRVDTKRPRILLEDHRSEYPTAPSMTIPKPSGPRTVHEPGSMKSNRPVGDQRHVVRMFRSRSGAPCGDDPGRPGRDRTLPRPGTRTTSRWSRFEARRPNGDHWNRCQSSRWTFWPHRNHAPFANIGLVLVGIPRTEHAPTLPTPLICQLPRAPTLAVTPLIAALSLMP